MPEYLSPGVYVEEVSYRAKSIQGLGTTTTGFIGPTRYGPVDIPPDVITSIGEFERTYGDRQQMQFGGPTTMHNFMWHAARAFFEEGGTKLYVSRVFTPMAHRGRATPRMEKLPIRSLPPAQASTCRLAFPGSLATCTCASPCN